MIIKKQIKIIPLKQVRTLHIYLPKQCNGPLDVLYMFDGHNLFLDEDATYGKSWGLKQYLDAQPNNLMIVGLECNHEGNSRLCEFSPYSFIDDILGDVNACGKALMEWMVKTLKPWIEQNYDVNTNKANTSIGGSSMGGLMALYAGIAYPKVYGKAICISPFYHHVYASLLSDIASTSRLSTSQFYLSWGGKEFATQSALAQGVENNLQVARILTNKKATVYTHCYPLGSHNEASWEKEIPIFMKELQLI